MGLTLDIRSQKLFLVLLCLSFFFHLGIAFKHVSWQSLNLNPENVEATPLVIKIKTKNPKQIVRTRKSKNKVPSAAEYLSEETNTFERETTANTIGVYKNAGIGQKDGLENSPQRKNKRKKSQLKKVAKLKDFTLSKSMDFSEIEKDRELKLSKKGLANGSAQEKGLSANNDYLENVPLGDFTQLNSQEFKYYGFYNRIRARLENFWGASVQEKSAELFKSGRRFPASENYVTSLIIKIDAQGVIREVKVKSSSGVRELDEAATESFNKAGPFPNPPKELVKKGFATIEWGFVVKS